MRCRACAYENEAASRFCAACGVAHRSGPALIAVGISRKAPDSALGAVSRGNPKPAWPRWPGERKQATVLFADIAGSTERIAALDAEAAMDFPASDRDGHVTCRAPLRRHGASHPGRRAQSRVRGAAWRARDTRLLACHAALAMRAAVAELPNAPPIRIGLHSGEVVSGKLDSGSSIEQDVTGLTVHLASRIEHEAPPGEICLSRDCQTSAPRLLRHRDAGSARVEGYSRSGGDLPP